VYNTEGILRVLKTGEETFDGGRTIFHFLPYFPEDTIYKSKLLSIIDKVNVRCKSKQNVLITHASISGVKNNDGSAVENELKSKLFDCFDLVIVGHYHNQSKVGKNIHYIGSAMPQNFGEDNDKGFIILNTETLVMTKYKPEFPNYYTEEFDVDDDNFKKEIAKQFTKYRGTKDKVRFKISGKPETLEKFDSTIYEESGILVIKDNINIIKNIELIGESGRVKYTNATLLSSFIEYCSETEMNSEQKKTGLKYFRGGLNVSNKENSN
jgi:DNA repair exonuclease SbcCD nuclease subunit